MFKKIWLLGLGLMMVVGVAFAEVDVNKADQVALDGIRGIGPTTSKNILDERKKGDFKNWSDFEARVKGVGGKKAAALSAAGLTVNGSARPATSEVAKNAKKEGGKDVKTADAGSAAKK